MKRAFFVSAWLTLPLIGSLAMGCGSSSTDDSSGSGASSGTGSGGANAATCNGKLKPVANADFCANTPGDLDCKEIAGFVNEECAVPLPEPQAELTRSANVKEYPGSGPPVVDCFVPGSADYPTPADVTQTKNVTVSGTAKIFSSGCQSHDLKITFYRVTRCAEGASCPNDGQLGDVVGSSVTTASDCKATGVMTADDKCGTRYECPYSYPMVPTETELAIKTEGDPTWAPLIQYNIYVSNKAAADNTYTQDVRALASDDYSVIPAVSLGGPVTAGNGVIAGEVHDCGDVRVIGAVADIDKPRKDRTYFTSDEENPLPDTKALGTSPLGLYAAFDITPGPVTVAAIGKVGGQDVALGQHHVWVYADSVTSVTFKGLQPYQLPK